MNILETRSVSVSGIYESDTTFGQLCVDKIIEHLTAYGFTAEPRANETAILWNGKPRFVLRASSSTTRASVRVAGPWSAASSWGNSYELFGISSTSSDLQTGTITFGFFAIGDVAFFVLSANDPCASLPCQTIRGTESVVLVRRGGEMVVPLFAETIDSTDTGKWAISVPSMYGAPADPELCAVSRGIAIVQNGIMHGFAESVATVKTKTPIDTGQVFTINGETYVSFSGELCARVSTA